MPTSPTGGLLEWSIHYSTIIKWENLSSFEDFCPHILAKTCHLLKLNWFFDLSLSLNSQIYNLTLQWFLWIRGSGVEVRLTIAAENWVTCSTDQAQTGPEGWLLIQNIKWHSASAQLCKTSSCHQKIVWLSLLILHRQVANPEHQMTPCQCPALQDFITSLPASANCAPAFVLMVFYRGQLVQHCNKELTTVTWLWTLG